MRGDYLPWIFDLFTPDDIRFAFFKNSKPVIVNASIQHLYDIKRLFQPPVVGYFTSWYGMRYDGHYGGMSFHNGIDISAQIGTPIRPVREGIVAFTGWKDGYGYSIIIHHLDGYISFYGHLRKITVRKGEMVSKSDTIGLLGTTGRTTGPHLHFIMMRHGSYIDPLLFIW